MTTNNFPNSAKLINYSAPEYAIAVAAWASTKLTGADLDFVPVENRLDLVFESNKDSRLRSPEELIRFLAENGHTSPFRHVTLTYLITSDLATHVQFLKHRVGVEINSESARYHRLEESFWQPQDLNITEYNRLLEHQRDCYKKYQDCYERLIEQGYSKARAKEIARYYLPTSYQLRYVATLSLQALGHFYDLRHSDHAQAEIRDIAEMMLDELELSGAFPISTELIKSGKLK